MTYTPEDFGPFTLSASSHKSPADGMCVMEMVSFLAGEEWSDMPTCSSPVIARFCQSLNDRTDQAGRDRLQTYVPRLIGTASPEHDQERANYLAWQAIRVFAPIILEACDMADEADRLRNFEGDLNAAADAAYAAAWAAADAAAQAAADAAAQAAAYAAAQDAVLAAAYAAETGTNATQPAAFTLWATNAATKGAAEAAAEAAMFDALDGLLQIGPSGQGYTEEHMSRVGSLRHATKQFA